MKLTPQQFTQLQEALLSGFNREELRMMVYKGMGQELDDIASGDTHPALVFDLISWAQRTNGVPALIQAAVDANPNNEALKQVARDSAAWFVPVTSPSHAPIRPTVSRASENESEEKKRPFWTFWTTLPGILTAIGSVIGSIAVLVATLNSVGLLPRSSPTMAPTIEVTAPLAQPSLSPALTAAATLKPESTTTATSTRTSPPTATNASQASDIMTITIDGAVYVYVPPGSFQMGSDPKLDSFAADDEQPQTTVTLPGFWIMRTEVTNAQYARCVAAGACTAPNNNLWTDSRYAEHPVVDVDWNQASAYAKWAGGRLPTEAEWEKACRGTDGRIYPWGDNFPTSILANVNNDRGTESVGSHPAGASPYGALDMAGNVWEWTSSQYQAYPYNANDGRESPEGSGARTLRGGLVGSLGYYLRCAFRLGKYPVDRDSFGFRVMSPGS